MTRSSGSNGAVLGGWRRQNNEIFTVTFGDHLFLAEAGMRP